jgi:DNA primase
MDPQARAKYLNGPETAAFHKGHQLYGLSEARKMLAAAPPKTKDSGEEPPLAVVEGYMDVIACQRAGVPAVAPMGTALGEEQMEVLWRHHPEPTLSFDGDRAGRQAAARTMDRALPLLQPGKSFKFAIVEGGKDPDEVLREQGPAALKAQLANTTPFVQALFVRERDLEPLDTPERRTALKARLRKIAALIADKDLSAAYKEDLLGRFEQLWPTREAVYTVGAAARELSKRGWESRRARPTGATPAAKEARERLRQSSKPLAAALAFAALRDPALIDDKIESVGARGFGDEKLDALAQELVRLRYEAESLSFDASLRHLQSRGFSAEALQALERDARRAGVAAPFLEATGERARVLWRQAYDLLMELEALERAVESAVRDLDRDRDSSTLISLKSDRDQKRRLITSDWSNETPEEPVLPH